MKRSKKECDLQSCFFCRGCLKEWLPAIGLHRQNFNLKKGEILFQEGDPVTGVYFVYSGKVKVHKKWGDKELIVRFANQSAIVGHRGLGKAGTYPVSATAIEPVTVCFIDLDFFLTTLRVNHDFTFELMMFFAEELQLSERKMRNLAHMSVKGRVAQALLSLQDRFGTTTEGFINISLSRQDLASFAGTTYETVFRIINDLTQENVLSVSAKNIIILDRDRLIAFTRDWE